MEIAGRQVKTLQDLMDNVVDVVKDPIEAKAFMAEYRKATEFADANMGSVILYYSDEVRVKLVDRFGVAEPEYWKTMTAGDSYSMGFLDGQLNMAMLISERSKIDVTYIETPVLKKRTIANGDLLPNEPRNRTLDGI